MLNLNLPGDGDGGGLVTKSCTTLSTPWTIALQASLSMGFPRQENWSGLLFPSLGDLPDPGIKPACPELADGFFTHLASWEAQVDVTIHIYAGSYILKFVSLKDSEREWRTLTSWPFSYTTTDNPGTVTSPF